MLAVNEFIVRLRMQNQTCYDEENEENDAEDLLGGLEVSGAAMTDHLQQEC